VIIELPDGDTYGSGDKVKLVITVRDPDGVDEFSWGVFAQNGSPTGLGDDQDCRNATECKIETDFNAALTGQFFIGVDAMDALGNKVREIVQLYIG
jgi:hypothetical protein